jgi:hypothetical protein
MHAGMHYIALTDDGYSNLLFLLLLVLRAPIVGGRRVKMILLPGL